MKNKITLYVQNLIITIFDHYTILYYTKINQLQIMFSVESADTNVSIMNARPTSHTMRFYIKTQDNKKFLIPAIKNSLRNE